MSSSRSVSLSDVGRGGVHSSDHGESKDGERAGELHDKG